MKLETLKLQNVPEKITMAKTSSANQNLWLPFWMHSCDTEAVMGYLLNSWVSQAEKHILRSLKNGAELQITEMYQAGRLLSMIHDIGKVTAEFQSQITRGFPSKKEMLESRGLIVKLPEKQQNHARLGQRIILRDDEQAENLKTIACVVGAHHGKPESKASVGARPYDPNGAWQQLQEAWIMYILDESGYQSMADLPAFSKTGQMVWTGLLIMADWIASNPYYFPLIPVDEDGSKVDYEERRKTAIGKLHLTSPWLPEECWDESMLYETRFGFAPNEIQQMMCEAVQTTQQPGIFILEAQMGVGKTEAALAAAEMIAAKTMHSGVYFGLPTQATANGIFGRLKAWVESQSTQEAHSIRLAHGSAELNETYQALLKGQAELNDQEDGAMVHSWFSGRKQALLADFVIGTVDQLLMAGLKQKHVMLRHLGLANKIVVIDECHAYDAYMNQYLEAALRWLGAYHVPVILLSATLPADRRKDFILAYQNCKKSKIQSAPWIEEHSYPLVTWTDGMKVCSQRVQHVEVDREVCWTAASFANDDFASLAQSLKEKLYAGGCVGIIVNTVQRAQSCAAELRQRFEDDEICVIHAQYLMPDRAERERQLVQTLGKKAVKGDGRPERLIVVGTQVLEQSLDIDFDYLVTDLCPMDLLLQRIGRLHRHKGRIRPPNFKKPNCQILCMCDDCLEPGAEAIYGAYLLMRTREILKDYGSLKLPGDISILVQKTYDPNWEPEAADEAYWTAKRKDEESRRDQEQRARAYCIEKPDSFAHPDCYGLLDRGVIETEQYGRAAVRDGDPSLDVLCMKRGPDEGLYLMEDQAFQFPISVQRVPSEDEAKKIARQRLRLPHRLCVKGRIDKVIMELERKTAQTVPEWLFSSWLHGELFLLFDEHNTAQVLDYLLHYSARNGLEVERMEHI